MSFAFPSLFFIWIAPLVALPVLIHLINLLRHRRVQWAAMEFLLESKKKHQNWIRLKQLLLLLLRMAVVAAIVFLMAGPLLKDTWSQLFGGGKTHHVVLLDDSGSMLEQGPVSSAFDRARDVIANVVQRAAQENAEHSLTLLRFSHAAAGAHPEFLHEPLTDEFLAEIDELKSELAPTQLSVGPLKTLDALERTLKPDDDEDLVVYVVSDFRAEQWQDATALRQAVSRVADMNAQLQFVQCVKKSRPNLAVTHLAPMPGQQAAGVRMTMELEVTNFSKAVSPPVAVQVQQRIHSSQLGGPGEIMSLGSVKFDKLDAGRTARRTFEVSFNTSGFHEVRARLPADVLVADNERFCVLDVPAVVPVLMLDGGGPDSTEGLEAIFSSSPKISTGLKSQVEPPHFLREHQIDRFHAIYAINLGQLNQREVESIESYVRNGGGLVVFCSDVMRRDYVNRELYRDGEGFFPLPLAAPANLLVDRLEQTPDLVVDQSHPMFSRMFASKYNSLVQLMMVDRYYAADKQWRVEDEPGVEVIASLRNGAPLMVEKRFGAGRVIAILTTAAPIWNNWAGGIPFPPILLDSQIYLGSEKVYNPMYDIGANYELDLPEMTYQADIEFVVPDGDQGKTISSPAKIDPADQSRRIARLDETDKAGIYEVHLKRAGDGTSEIRRFAMNFGAAESDLESMAEPELRAVLDNVEIQYRDADEFLAPVERQAGFALAEQWWFFLILVVLLCLEQLLGYSASYHAPLTGGKRK
ncbi:MAG: BatA domain-containing protein [Pirellulales bacterium]